jgi:polysaccharide export outer membrane protein
MNRRTRSVTLWALLLLSWQVVSIAGQSGSVTNGATTAATTAPERYRFGTNDSFLVRGPDIEEIGERPFRIDPSGTVTFPMVGSIHVAGMTVAELEAELNQRLQKFVKTPAVSVSVTEINSHPISVFGAVNASGVQQAQGTKSLVEALSTAGGLRNDAGNVLTVTRAVESGPLPLAGAELTATGKFWVAHVDVMQLMSAERPDDNIQLVANDVVTVQKANLVYVIGDVNRSGAIPLVGRLTVTEALAKSEGLQKSASRKNIRILREVAGNAKRTEISVDFQKVLRGRAEDQELLANDIVIIPNNVSRSAALRTIEAALQVGTGLIIWGL